MDIETTWINPGQADKLAEIAQYRDPAKGERVGVAISRVQLHPPNYGIPLPHTEMIYVTQRRRRNAEDPDGFTYAALIARDGTVLDERPPS